MNTQHREEAMSKQRRFVRTPEAAEYCGIGESTLEKYRVYGGGPTYLKAGRTVLYDVDDIDRWLASLRRKSTSKAAPAQ
jgi:predicted DNA-binding transcriptional regulator AlpA